jgi:hypothetical protein
MDLHYQGLLLVCEQLELLIVVKRLEERKKLVLVTAKDSLDVRQRLRFRNEDLSEDE